MKNYLMVKEGKSLEMAKRYLIKSCKPFYMRHKHFLLLKVVSVLVSAEIVLILEIVVQVMVCLGIVLVKKSMLLILAINIVKPVKGLQEVECKMQVTWLVVLGIILIRG